MKMKPFLPFIVATVISGCLADKLLAGSGGTFNLQTGRLTGDGVIRRLMHIDRW